MSSEEKAPYFSHRVRIADVKSTKEFVGYKERTIEVTFGNSIETKISTDPNDAGDIKFQNMKEVFLDLFKITDEVAEARGFKFMDKVGAEK